MNNFIDPHGGCFNGEAIVLLTDNQQKMVKNLKKGDKLNNGAGSNAQRTWSERMREVLKVYNQAKGNKGSDDISMNDFLQMLDADLADQFEEILSQNNGKATIREMNSEGLKVVKNIIDNNRKIILNKK